MSKEGLSSNLGGPSPTLSLVIPSFGPGKGAHGLVDPLEPFTWLVIFPLELLAPVVVSVILPAVLGLVGVGEAGVKGRRGVVL